MVVARLQGWSSRDVVMVRPTRGAGGGVVLVVAGGPLGTAQPKVDSGWAKRFLCGYI